MSFLYKFTNGYRFTALVLLNTFIALILLNTILFMLFAAKDYLSQDPVSNKYGQSTLDTVYQGMDRTAINTLLKETWSRSYVYEPFTQFKERTYQGSYVNVDVNGFRVTKNQGMWPLQSENLNIFLFGGSTTFGYGVSDHQTVASYLQLSLSQNLDQVVRVYNFGRGHYYSTQERILFEELLASGMVPDIAIFIDGLNDFFHKSNEPRFTGTFRNLLAQETTDNTSRSFFLESFYKTSLGRAVSGVERRLSKLAQKKELSEEQLAKNIEFNVKPAEYADPDVINSVIERYFANKKLIEAIAPSFKITPIFIWQPVPMYNYDQRFHPFSENGYGPHSYSEYGYKRMAEVLEQTPQGNNFLWCADIQKNEKEPLYVDLVHYSAKFTEKFALHIANSIILHALEAK